MNVLNWLSAKDSIGNLFCFSVAQGDIPFLHSFQESKPPTFTVSPWPFFPAGTHINLNVTFAPGKLKLTWRC